MTGKTMMLLPGTACDYQTNFGSVLDALEKKYHVICVNYDGFDGSSLVFSDMLTVTRKPDTDADHVMKYLVADYKL